MTPRQSLLALASLLSTICLFQNSQAAAPTNSTSLTQTAPSPAEQMNALRQEVDDAEAAYVHAARPEADKLWKTFVHINDTNLPKILDLARQDPASETSFKMFEWIVRNRRISIPSLYNSNAIPAVEFLRDYHTANTNIGPICSKFGWGWPRACQPVVDFLQTAAAKNPSRASRGQAALALARLDKTFADILVALSETSLTNSRAWTKNDEAEFLAVVKHQTAADVSLQAEKLLQTVLADYADCSTEAPTNTILYSRTLGEVAKTELFELQHLTVGKQAPEIEGEDIAGKKLKLSDYRGKIVMLSFWATWCGPCMQMVPSELKLAERLKGKPFVLIGVNGDTDRLAAQRAMEKEHITWPSLWDKAGDDGPIPKTWNILGWPTVFLLDGHGVIVFKGENMERLNQKIDQLLAALPDKNRP